jgi:glucan phosphoethanolaminetransferase (alkaline phosphatase superfamily)
MLGFPDGHATALGLAERTLAYVFISMSAIVASFSIYLATTASARRWRPGLAVLIAIYSLASIGMFCLDRFYFKSVLNDIG